MSTGQRVFVNEDLARGILDACQTAEMLRLRLLNRAMYETFKSYSRTVMNIDRILNRFFPDPSTFQVLQRQTATLISGSQALQFFDRSFYPESDLDLYLFPGRQYDVGRYLLGIGYTYVPMVGQRHRPSFMSPTEPKNVYPRLHWERRTTVKERDYPEAFDGYGEPPDLPHEGLNLEGRAIQCIYNFVKQDSEDPKRSVSVQLLIARRSPIKAILSSFHSTIVLNIISYEMAYSLYPYSTFLDRSSLLIHHSTITKPALVKYQSRGWTVAEAPETMSPQAQLRMSRRLRYINDGDSWVIALSALPPHRPRATTSLSIAASLQRSQHDPMSISSWKIITCDDNTVYASKNGLRFYVIYCHSLHYSYVVGDEKAIDLEQWEAAGKLNTVTFRRSRPKPLKFLAPPPQDDKLIEYLCMVNPQLQRHDQRLIDAFNKSVAELMKTHGDLYRLSIQPHAQPIGESWDYYRILDSDGESEYDED